MIYCILKYSSFVLNFVQKYLSILEIQHVSLVVLNKELAVFRGKQLIIAGLDCFQEKQIVNLHLVKSIREDEINCDEIYPQAEWSAHLTVLVMSVNGLGCGLLSQFPPFRYFPNFSVSLKHTLPIEYRVYIWQVSPQLSCGGTCQI